MAGSHVNADGSQRRPAGSLPKPTFPNWSGRLVALLFGEAASDGSQCPANVRSAPGPRQLGSGHDGWVARAEEEAVELDDGAVLATVTEGEGRPVAVCHGGPGGTDTLGPISAMIADSARVHRYDQRGCGRSSGGPPFTMARWIADLEELRLHWGHQRWVVSGHSFGAALALAYALEHPDRTEAVLFVSCCVRLPGQPDWYAEFRRARLERIPRAEQARFIELRRRRDGAGGLNAQERSELRKMSARTDFGDPAAADRFGPQMEAELSIVNQVVNRKLGADFERYFAASSVPGKLRGLDLPVLVIHGDADPRPVAAAEALAAMLPRSSMAVQSGVGHYPHLEAPEPFRQVVRDFLQRDVQ
jgi:proline iminopeptidase